MSEEEFDDRFLRLAQQFETERAEAAIDQAAQGNLLTYIAYRDSINKPLDSEKFKRLSNCVAHVFNLQGVDLTAAYLKSYTRQEAIHKSTQYITLEDDTSGEA